MKINYIIWIAAAAVLGFAVSAIFAGQLGLPRNFYLIPYFLLTSTLLYAYVRVNQIRVLEIIKHNWYWGLIGGAVLCAFTVWNVLSQPASARPEGARLIFDILYSGVLYGTMDALLLSVLPVHAVWMAFSDTPLNQSLAGKILIGLIAFTASLLVTTAYHLGYPEYHSAAMRGPVIGNGAMTLGYLVTGNPIAAVFSHIGMHIAGVLHGAATVTQLPPHYLP